jgi:hypothetical protein
MIAALWVLLVSTYTLYCETNLLSEAYTTSILAYTRVAIPYGCISNISTVLLVTH